jgi:hypothetical protein
MSLNQATLKNTVPLVCDAQAAVEVLLLDLSAILAENVRESCALLEQLQDECRKLRRLI